MTSQCSNYLCTNRNDFGYCKTTTCINPMYNQLSIARVKIMNETGGKIITERNLDYELSEEKSSDGHMTCVCGNDMTKAEWKHQWVCHRCGRKKPINIKKTNADRIRAMSDEEMAILLTGSPCPPFRRNSDYDCVSYSSCKDCWLLWLKQEVE